MRNLHFLTLMTSSFIPPHSLIISPTSTPHCRDWKTMGSQSKAANVHGVTQHLNFEFYSWIRRNRNSTSQGRIHGQIQNPKNKAESIPWSCKLLFPIHTFICTTYQLVVTAHQTLRIKPCTLGCHYQTSI